jgi:hypothetical protein
LTWRSRCDIVLATIVRSVGRRDRERFIAEYVAEAAAGYRNPILRREAIEIAEDFDGLECEAPDFAGAADLEERLRAESGEKWWE